MLPAKSHGAPPWQAGPMAQLACGSKLVPCLRYTLGLVGVGRCGRGQCWAFLVLFSPSRGFCEPSTPCSPATHARAAAYNAALERPLSSGGMAGIPAVHGEAPAVGSTP
eukprot:363314-Chlamydomonas_euryale.AAC.4